MMATVTHLTSVHITLKRMYYESVTLFLYTHKLCMLSLKSFK